MKLTRGALTNVLGLLEHEGREEAMLEETSSQELFVCILESMLSEVRYCIDKRILTCTENDHQALCLELGALFDVSLENIRLDQLSRSLGSLRRAIARYLRRRFVYREEVEAPTVTFDAGLVAEAVATIKKHIQELANHGFVILLDEYENLCGFQQEIINGLAKAAAPEFSVKIARKRSGMYPSSTPTGQGITGDARLLKN